MKVYRNTFSSQSTSDPFNKTNYQAYIHAISAVSTRVLVIKLSHILLINVVSALKKGIIREFAPAFSHLQGPCISALHTVATVQDIQDSDIQASAQVSKLFDSKR